MLIIIKDVIKEIFSQIRKCTDCHYYVYDPDQIFCPVCGQELPQWKA